MRVLMINSNRFTHPWPVIPFGLCCVADALKEAGYDVQVLDLNFLKKPANAIFDTIKSFQPDAVGISIRNIDNGGGYRTIFLLEQVRDEVIERVKAVFSGPIIIGGPAVGISAAEILELFDLKFAIRGDGETAMVELLHRMERNLPLDDLQGLALRKDGKVIQNNPPNRVVNLDSLPFTRPHLSIDIRPYEKIGSPLQIQTKRGCALSCVYCTYKLIEGDHYRLKSPERVADEIEKLVRETGINHIEFTDSTFNIPLDHAKSILRAIKTKNLDLRLRTMGLNPGAMDEELVDLMKEVGFEDVDLGAESCCDATLKSLGKNFTKKDVIQAARLLQKKKIPTSWFLLLGAPSETLETVRETLDTVSEVASKWDLIVVGIGLRIYNNAPIVERAKLENPHCTSDNFLRPISFNPPKIDLDTIKVVTKLAAFKNPSIYMYDENLHLPARFLAVVNTLVQWIVPGQPLWRMTILDRMVRKYCGITAIERFFYKREHKIIVNSLI